MGILSKEAKEILDCLKGQITSEDKKWLIVYFPAWADSLETPDWDKKWANNSWDIYQRITEILDAKVREVRHHAFVDPLDKDDILEIAKIFNLKVSFRTKKQKIINMIFEEIRKCPRCKKVKKNSNSLSTKRTAN